MNEANKQDEAGGPAWRRPTRSLRRLAASWLLGRTCKFCPRLSDIVHDTWMTEDGRAPVPMCLACWDQMKARMVGAIEARVAEMKVAGEWPPKFPCGHEVRP